MRVCFVVSNPFALNAFLAAPIQALAAQGWKITVAVNPCQGDIVETVLQNATIVPIDLMRQISPWHDTLALVQLWWLFRRRRFDVVHSITPKAGLLAMVAARGAGVPARLHTFCGQVWATRRGMMRRLLRAMDGIVASCATKLLTDSASQREFIAQEGVAAEARIQVLGQGSICGVDTERFKPDLASRRDLREELSIPQTAILLLYLGRLHPEKGLSELGQAFEKLSIVFSDLYLVLAGPDEGGARLVDEAVIFAPERVRKPGLTGEPQRYVAAADLFSLPSYREGFGLTLIEAAAAGVPSVATRIYGITDAVQDGVTGVLVPPRDVEALTHALSALTSTPTLRYKMGESARQRVLQRFSQTMLLKAWLALYVEQMAEVARMRPSENQPAQ